MEYPRTHKGAFRFVALRTAARWVRNIEIECKRCGRYGRMPVQTAMKRYGRYTDIWEVVLAVSKGCPRQQKGTYITERCLVCCPTLLRIPEDGGRP